MPILIDGLKNFSLELFPQYFDPLKVQKFIDSTFRINESKTSETAIDRLSDNTLNRMQIKEWLLMCRY